MFSQDEKGDPLLVSRKSQETRGRRVPTSQPPVKSFAWHPHVLKWGI